MVNAVNGLVQFNDTTPSATYTNVGNCTWSAGGSVDAGTFHTAFGGPCSASFVFNGTFGGLIGDFNWNHGVYSCAVDNEPETWYNGNTETNIHGQNMCAIGGLQNGTHTLTVRAGPYPELVLPVNFWVVSVEATPAGWTSDAANSAFNPSNVLTRVLTSTSIATATVTAPAAPPLSASGGKTNESSSSKINTGVLAALGVVAGLSLVAAFVAVWLLYKARKDRRVSVNAAAGAESIVSWYPADNARSNGFSGYSEPMGR
ncbi:hypothetical protein RQP46_010562 [Phenoliferia psychrophenolica]